MKKLQEINRLVEEAFVDLGIVTRTERQENALNKLARKCAEINEEDFNDCWQPHSREPIIIARVEIYNSRLRDGQVEELHPAIQHINAEDELPNETVKAINKMAEVAYNTSMKPALQPLPEKAPEWFMDSFLRQHALEEWNKIRQHFGTQPPEWWMDLKKGDKFVCYKESWVFDDIMLKAGDGRAFYLSKCSPYTDPAQSFRSKLTPEMQAEFDNVVETINNK